MKRRLTQSYKPKRRRIFERRGRPRKHHFWSSLAYLAGVFTCLSSIILGVNHLSHQFFPPRVYAESLVAPIIEEAKNLPTATPSATPKPVSHNPVSQGLVAIVSKVRQYFASPSDFETAISIFKAESGLRPDAHSTNCWFDGNPWNGGKPTDHKTSWSWQCPAGSENLAWSVDCGIAQIDLVGIKSCPAYSFDVDWNLSMAKSKHDWRKASGLTGWEAWTTFNDGRYKRNLDWAATLLK